MSVLLSIGASLLWILGAVAVYTACRKTKEESAFVDLIGSLAFWWLVLPFVMARTGWLAAEHYAARLIKWSEARKQLPQSGTESGLYE